MFMRNVSIVLFAAMSLFAAACNNMSSNNAVTNRSMANNAAAHTPMATATPMASTNSNSLPAGATTTVAAIQDNTDAWVGKTVTVVADVEEVWGPRAFSLDEDSMTTGGIDNDIAVLSPKAGSLANIDDQWRNNKVKVTGVVHRFVVVEIEKELGWDLDPKIETEIEARKPVIIATAVERVSDK